MTKPLEEILVLALEQAVAAPFCSVRLADAGARVIKIERAEGDFARFYDRAGGADSSYFVWLNRGKESLVADVKQPEDQHLLHAILAKADVFIQNLAPGAAARAGFGSEALRKRYPRLITVDISGYGADGPYADMKAYDLLVQAESGLASVTGLPEAPGRAGISVCDISCGATAYSAVLEALILRQRTGQGSTVSVSLFDTMADWMNVPLLQYEGLGKMPARVGLAHPSICPYGTFETADGMPVVIAIQNEREWADFCRDVLRDASLAKRPGYDSNDARMANRAEVDHKVASIIRSLSKEETTLRLHTAKTAYGVVNDVAGLARHAALRRISVETSGGVISMAAPAARNDGVPPVFGHVPAIGEHSTAIRNEFAVSDR